MSDVHEKIPEAGPWGDEAEKSRYELDFLDLNENSVGLDIGGFRGEWAKKISDKYNFKIHVYEPVPEFSNHIRGLAKKDENLILYNKALGTHSGLVQMMISDEGSSIEKYGKRTNPSHKGSSEKYASSKKMMVIQDNIDDVIGELKTIDVMKVNTEGSEYELMFRLIETGAINNIRYLQIQFHSFVENANEMYEQIKSKMEETHDLVLDSRWKWTFWKIKGGD